MSLIENINNANRTYNSVINGYIIKYNNLYNNNPASTTANGAQMNTFVSGAQTALNAYIANQAIYLKADAIVALDESTPVWDTVVQSSNALVFQNSDFLSNYAESVTFAVNNYVKNTASSSASNAPQLAQFNNEIAAAVDTYMSDNYPNQNIISDNYTKSVFNEYIGAMDGLLSDYVAVVVANSLAELNAYKSSMAAAATAYSAAINAAIKTDFSASCTQLLAALSADLLVLEITLNAVYPIPTQPLVRKISSENTVPVEVITDEINTSLAKIDVKSDIVPLLDVAEEENEEFDNLDHHISEISLSALLNKIKKNTPYRNSPIKKQQPQ